MKSHHSAYYGWLGNLGNQNCGTIEQPEGLPMWHYKMNNNSLQTDLWASKTNDYNLSLSRSRIDPTIRDLSIPDERQS